MNIAPARKLGLADIADIRAYERYLHNNGIIVRKFFLHVSRDEQKRRFLDRINKPIMEAGGLVRARDLLARARTARTMTRSTPW